ncbi:MAG: MBL fold metallo-hydrolase [Anaerolineae bacterium]|nr:MBL fold metallo-hydrolase [Anaerolineae bacterium]
MPNYICMTCGVQYAESATPPARCTICADERQYVKASGQQWTTLDDLRKRYHNEIRTVEPNLTGIATVPGFTIGQRPLLIQTPNGNVLWDCISLIDDVTVAALNALGGVDAIAVSHPHFYDSMVEWSHAFGGIPIYLHESNREWVMRPDAVIHFWAGETFDLGNDLTIIRAGGHFPGSSVLHWASGAESKGVLLTGDTIMALPDGNVSFMYSYPNYIPLSPTPVRRIVAAVEPFAYDRIYSPWDGKVIPADAKAIVQHSMERYIAHITE